jgi:Domain of unknown function (DUF4340)
MRRSTIVIILLLLIVAGAYYYVNNHAKSADVSLTQEPTTQAVSYLFNAQDGIPTDIRVESKTGETVELARNAQNAWALKQPIETAAEQRAAEAAASQVTTIQVTAHLPNTVSLKDVGLDAPAYTLIVKFTNGVERKANIGVVTPSESGYYVQLDGAGQIVIVSKDSIDALIGLLTNPPYAETLTPSPTAPTPTETPLPPTLGPTTPTESTATPTP